MKKIILIAMTLLSLMSGLAFAGGQAFTCCECTNGTFFWNNTATCGTGCAPTATYTTEASCLAANPNCYSHVQTYQPVLEAIGCN